MVSIAQDLALTRTARWLLEARTAQPSAWADHLRCFDAFNRILDSRRPASVAGKLVQPPVNAPGLLKEVARGAHLSTASVYQRWGPKQKGRAIRRWAGTDLGVVPREAFVAEAKIVSFWPYREGALAIADTFEMSLIEVAESYLRALGAWVLGNPALAACAPAGPPPCVAEDMLVLAHRGAALRTSPGFDAVAAAASLESLTCDLVAAVLDDLSLTPLGAFNVIRDATIRLLAAPSEPIAVKVSNALTELADKLLHSRGEERVLTAAQARQLHAEIAGLNALLSYVGGEQAGSGGADR